jgi:hypothetical protein
VQNKALFKESTRYMIERIWQTTNLCIIKVFYYNVESLLLFRKETERWSCRSEVSSYFLLLDTFHQSILAIYASMIYTASCIMLLMRADPYSFDTDPDPAF